MPSRVVEILCLASCPHVQPTVDRVRAESAAAGVAVDVRLTNVETEEQAYRIRFLGSPSVRIEGRDVEPAAEERRDYGLKCRVYASDDGLGGVPSARWIRAALLGDPAT